jgi:DNA polymerase III gamma/tau subunit
VVKTTTARIIQKRLGCNSRTFQEINVADYNGIATIRDLKQLTRWKSLHGDNTCILLDECFAAGTEISMPGGIIAPIESILPGEIIISMGGPAKVEKVFKNKIFLDRVIRLDFDDGKVIFTTADHQMFSTLGWIPAGLSLGHYFFSPLSDMMSEVTKESWEVHEEDVPLVPERIHAGKPRTGSDLLLEKLQPEIEAEKSGQREDGSSEMQVVQREVPNLIQEEKKVLLKKLCQEIRYVPTGISGETIQRESSGEDQQGTSGVAQNQEGEKTGQNALKKDAGKESNVRSCHLTKDVGNQRAQWNSSPVERRTWRQRKIDQTTEEIGKEIGRGLGCGISNQDEKETAGLPPLLQSGYCQPKYEISNRDRWQGTQVEESFLARCKENKAARIARVVRAAVYQQGSNDKDFAGVISNQERIRGFVDFYDLQIAGHPSYFAEGIPVHNCHELTRPAQEALLKLLEDANDEFPHLYFLLGTTEPESLIKTLKSRCVELVFQPIDEEELVKLAIEVSAKEGVELDSEVAGKIAEMSEGSARQALNFLDKVVNKPAKKQLRLLESEDIRKTSHSLAKYLMDTRSKWRDIAKLLRENKEPADKIRRGVMGYAAAAMKRGDKVNGRALMILTTMEEPFYQYNDANLTRACAQIFVDKTN